MCVIADAQGVESLAGIMGGEASGCSETTTDVLVELALWDPLNIAQTGRKLGIVSDARFRFERGVDPAFTIPGLELATQLILDLCGGEPSEIVLAGKIPDDKRTIEFPFAEVKRLTGLDVPAVETQTRAHGARLQGRALRRARHRHRALVARRRGGQGRPRGGSDPHRRRRPRAGGAVRRPRRRAPAGADPDPAAHPRRQARARRPRPRGGRDLVVHRQGRGGGVRRRATGARARQPDRRRAFPHAAEPDPGLGARGAKERRPRLSGSGAVRGRADLHGRQAGGAAHRRHRAPPRQRQGCGHRPPLVGRVGRRRRVRRQGRRAGRARRRRRAGGQGADRAGRTGVPASRPLRHDPARAQARARLFRRAAPVGAQSPRRRRSNRCRRGHSRAHPRAEGEKPQQTGAGAVAVPTHRARLRLHRRPQGDRRRRGARRAARPTRT